MSALMQIASDAVVVGAVNAVLMGMWPLLRPGAVVCTAAVAVTYGVWLLMTDPTGASMAMRGPDAGTAAYAAVTAGPIAATAAVMARIARTRSAPAPATAAAGAVAALAAWLEPLIGVLVR